MRNLKRVLALALAVVMMIGMMVTASAATYADEAAIDAKYATAVEVTSDMGLFRGQGTGFAPKATLTRAEAAAILYRVMTTDVTDSKISLYDYESAKLADIEAGKWYTGYINFANNGGYVMGDGTNFYPLMTVTGTQFLAMMLRALGYGQMGEYEGAAWIDNVLTDASEKGLLAGIANVASLNAPATRELVAQLLWNALRTDMTTYTPALGYVTSLLTGANTLGETKFKLKSASATDTWGRPQTKWYADKNNDNVAQTAEVYTTLTDTPVLTYTAAVKVCQLVADLGLKTNDTTQIHKNSSSAMYTAYALNYLDTTTTLYGTDTGVLTEVYKLANGDYRVVEIDTYLAKVGTVTPAKVDANGHITPASTNLTVYLANAGGISATYETEAFARGQYVLVNRTTDGVIREVKAATPAAAALTGYNTFTETSTLGGVEYKWSAHYYVGNPGTLFKTYNVYTDTYGNVIGLTEQSAAYNYGIITDMAWANSYNPLDAAKVYANIKGFAAEADASTTVLDVALTDGDAFTSSDATAGVPGSLTVSTIKANNDDYYDTAYKFTTAPNGARVIVAVGNAQTGVNFITGVPTVVTAASAYYATNDNTVYLVKTGSAATGYTYTSYTGYKTIPGMTGTNISFFAEDGYVTYCFVDASSATFTGASEVAYVGTAANVGQNNGLYAYYVNVKGTNTLKFSTASSLSSFIGVGLYTVTYDANGYITGIAAWNGDVVVNNVTFYNGTVITNNTSNAAASVNCTNAGLWKVVPGVGIVPGTAAELTAGNVTAYLDKNTAGVVTDIYYVG